MLYQKLRPTGRVDCLNLPRLDGVDLRWKDSTIATDTIAMYILSFNQERNAAKPISINVVLQSQQRTSLVGRNIPRF
jgi:hypothetical protein